jgi:hypothetical protein
VFAGLINHAKAAASGLVDKYVARASVAVPFVVAAAFALAAITLMLIERFGHVTAYWLVAGGLTAVGVVAAVAVSAKEHEEEVAEQKMEQAHTPQLVSEVASQAPLALLGGLFATPGGPSSALAFARLLGRNLPLVALLLLIAALFWSTEGAAKEDPAEHSGEPN